MKKFLLLSLLAGAMLCFNSTAKAQTNVYGSGQLFPLIAGDTLVNVDTVMKVITTTAGYRDMGVQVLVTTLTGTPAGKLILLGSMDGLTYTATDSIALSAKQVNSAIPTGGANLTAFVWKTGVPFSHYMVMATNTASTTTAIVRVWYTLRREQVTPVY